MPDREKVMQWLKTCANGCEDGCPYEYKNLVYRVECKADLMGDALDLLREQDTVEHAIEVLKAHGWKDDSEVSGDAVLGSVSKA